MTNRTKKQMVEEIQKTKPWKSVSYLNRQTLETVKGIYQEAVKLGLIKN